MEPITRGKYPRSMEKYVGSRLPNFTEEQSKQLIGSFDFIGLNYYTSNYAAHLFHPNNDTDPTYWTDQHVNLTSKYTLI